MESITAQIKTFILAQAFSQPSGRPVKSFSMEETSADGRKYSTWLTSRGHRFLIHNEPTCIYIDRCIICFELANLVLVKSSAIWPRGRKRSECFILIRWTVSKKCFRVPVWSQFVSLCLLNAYRERKHPGGARVVCRRLVPQQQKKICASWRRRDARMRRVLRASAAKASLTQTNK